VRIHVYCIKSQSTVVFIIIIIIAVINKKGKTAARKTFSDVPFIGKVVRSGERVYRRVVVALCTIYINNVHERLQRIKVRDIYT